jgi:hypothetical protein
MKTVMRRFLIAEINRYVIKCGNNREKLSLALGHAENYVQLKLTTQLKFAALERLWKECREKIK